MTAGEYPKDTSYPINIGSDMVEMVHGLEEPSSRFLIPLDGGWNLLMAPIPSIRGNQGDALYILLHDSGLAYAFSGSKASSYNSRTVGWLPTVGAIANRTLEDYMDGNKAKAAKPIVGNVGGNPMLAFSGQFWPMCPLTEVGAPSSIAADKVAIARGRVIGATKDWKDALSHAGDTKKARMAILVRYWDQWRVRHPYDMG